MSYDPDPARIPRRIRRYPGLVAAWLRRRLPRRRRAARRRARYDPEPAFRFRRLRARGRGLIRLNWLAKLGLLVLGFGLGKWAKPRVEEHVGKHITLPAEVERYKTGMLQLGIGGLLGACSPVARRFGGRRFGGLAATALKPLSFGYVLSGIHDLYEAWRGTPGATAQAPAGGLKVEPPKTTPVPPAVYTPVPPAVTTPVPPTAYLHELHTPISLAYAGVITPKEAYWLREGHPVHIYY